MHWRYCPRYRKPKVERGSCRSWLDQHSEVSMRWCYCLALHRPTLMIRSIRCHSRIAKGRHRFVVYEPEPCQHRSQHRTASQTHLKCSEPKNFRLPVKSFPLWGWQCLLQLFCNRYLLAKHSIRCCGKHHFLHYRLQVQRTYSPREEVKR